MVTKRRIHDRFRYFFNANGSGALWPSGAVFVADHRRRCCFFSPGSGQSSQAQPESRWALRLHPDAFGDFTGFIVAWTYWISLWTTTAAITVAAVGYIGVFVPALGENFRDSTITGLVIIALIIAINIAGIRQSGIFQLATTILKIIPLLAIGIIGLFFIEAANIPQTNPSGQAPLPVLASASILTMWAFVGLEAATVPAGNVVNPAKTIPSAMVTAVLAVIVIYFLSSFVVMGLIPGESLANSQAPFADAAVKIWGDWAAYGIAVGAIISTVGALNCNVLLTGQMPMAAAIDGLFPKAFGRLSRTGAPVFALVASGILGGVLMIASYSKGFVAAFTFMILLSTLAVVIAYAFSALAELKFTHNDKTIPGAKKIRNVLIAILALGFSIFLIISAGTETIMYAGILILAGVPVYLYLQRQNK